MRLIVMQLEHASTVTFFVMEMPRGGHRLTGRSRYTVCLALLNMSDRVFTCLAMRDPYLTMLDQYLTMPGPCLAHA